MKIKVVNERPLERIEPCCIGMMEAMQNYVQVIGFGDPNNRDRGGCLRVYYAVRDGGVGSMPIRFCPFCGEEIEIDREAA